LLDRMRLLSIALTAAKALAMLGYGNAGVCRWRTSIATFSRELRILP
jgi:hypothetical protein